MLFSYNGTIFTQSEVLDYFEEDDDFVFEEKDGLHFAIGIIDADENPENQEKLRQIFQLKAYMLDLTNYKNPVQEV